MNKEIDEKLDELLYSEGQDAFDRGCGIPTERAGYDPKHIEGYMDAQLEWMISVGLANPEEDDET